MAVNLVQSVGVSLSLPSNNVKTKASNSLLGPSASGGLEYFQEGTLTRVPGLADLEVTDYSQVTRSIRRPGNGDTREPGRQCEGPGNQLRETGTKSDTMIQLTETGDQRDIR